jgi:hypothetical protein
VPQVKDSLVKDSINGTAPSLFTGHEAQPRGLEPQPIERSHSFWIFSLLFTAFVIFVSLRVLYGKRFRQEVDAFFTSRAVSQMMREEYALSNRVSIGLSLLFLMLLSLFLFQCFSYYGYFGYNNFTGPVFYFRICAFVVIAFALKLLVVRILGVLFKLEAVSNEYIFNIFLYHKALGLFLFPITIAIAFVREIPVHYTIAAGWVLVAIVLVYRTLRSLLGGIQTAGISKYYLFLYLCTLEILPLIVIIKVFRSQTW